MEKKFGKAALAEFLKTAQDSSSSDENSVASVHVVETVPRAGIARSEDARHRKMMADQREAAEARKIVEDSNKKLTAVARKFCGLNVEDHEELVDAEAGAPPKKKRISWDPLRARLAPTPKIVTKRAQLLDAVFEASDDAIMIDEEPTRPSDNEEEKTLLKLLLKSVKKTGKKVKSTTNTRVAAPGSIIPSHVKNMKTIDQLTKEKEAKDKKTVQNLKEKFQARLETLGEPKEAS